ncbi:MAG: ATP-binding protein [Deltaproteobacteria bacterium]
MQGKKEDNMLRTNGSELEKEIARLREENSGLHEQIESLEESHAKYEAVVQAFDGFIYIWSPRYEIEFMNERLIERTGRTAVGEKCYRVLHELEHVCPWCVNERVFKGETVRWEVLSPKDDRWYSVVNTPLRHKDGSISKMAMIQDITERKRSEEEARKQNEFLHNVLESLPHPFYVINAHDYTVAMANSAARMSHSVESTTCYALTHGRDEPCNTLEHPCPLLEIKKTGKPVTVEHIHYDQNGDPRNVEVHAYPVFNSEGNVEQILEYGLDITDRKRVEADRERLIRQLETSNEDLKMFGWAVSHDLRSPLVTLRGFLPIVGRDALSGNIDRLQTSLSVMDRTAAKMENLLDDLKELSLVGSVEPPCQDVQLDEVAHEAVELLAGRIDEIGVEIEIDSNLPGLYGDRARLLQVLQNLIENAIKFRDPEGAPRIKIAARRQGSETVFYVKDNGIGIDLKDHEKIFGLFDRPDNHVEGTGFGLALVKRVVELHEGRVWVESAGHGHGSTFCFTWPKKCV